MIYPLKRRKKRHSRKELDKRILTYSEKDLKRIRDHGLKLRAADEHPKIEITKIHPTGWPKGDNLLFSVGAG